MVSKNALKRYQYWYKQLLSLYAKPYRERFGEGMLQTFNDVLNERMECNSKVHRYILWMYMETLTGIIKQNLKYMAMQTKNVLRVSIITVLLLLIPLVAMQFNTGVNWDAFDFIVMGILLFGAGMTFEFVASRGKTLAYRVAAGIAVLTSLLLVWVNLAVGIIGSENEDVNALYFIVLAVGFLGAIAVRLRASGLSGVLYAMAAVQMLVPTLAFTIIRPEIPVAEQAPGIIGIFVLNAVFATLFISAGLLFKKASQAY